MPEPLTHQIVHPMVLEVLSRLPSGQFADLHHAVKDLASQHGFSAHENVVAERVRESMWQCLVQGLLLFGMDASNQTWPFYKLTEHGRRVIQQGAPQPYDPDGFLTHFKRAVPQADPTAYSYLEEAVATFNHACPRAAAVMLGCASEKIILVLIDALDNAIADP